MSWFERDADRAIEEAEEYEQFRELVPKLEERIAYLEECARFRSEVIRKKCYARPCGLDREICRTCVERTHPLEGK